MGAEERCVLVVEDDAQVRALLVLALEDAGYCVHDAADGLSALEVAQRHPPDCIVLDLMLPTLDGAGFAAAYGQLDPPHAPLLVCSACHDGLRRAKDLGASAYLSKPFDLGALRATVAALIESP